MKNLTIYLVTVLTGVAALQKMICDGSVEFSLFDLSSYVTHAISAGRFSDADGSGVYFLSSDVSPDVRSALRIYENSNLSKVNIFVEQKVTQGVVASDGSSSTTYSWQPVRTIRCK